MMDEITLQFGAVDEAIAVMREVAAWGREKGFRVWPDAWLTRSELMTDEAQPENFCTCQIHGETVCAFILQWSDREYWPDAPKYEAAYLHKFCVRRKFAGMDMTRRIVEAVKAECIRRGIRFIRLDTALDEETVKNIYCNAGFQIVRVIDCGNCRPMALYELETGLSKNEGGNAK